MYEFTVKGFHTFPWDMLRFDNCFPATQEDVRAMLSVEDRTVTLRSHSIPTSARWESFLWPIIESKKLPRR